MKLVIEIRDDWYRFAKNNDIANGSMVAKEILTAVGNGVPYEERPVGYWIREYHDELPKCSVCNLKGFGEYDYCHHCGAKMLNASY